jgi:hypothetical protein
MAVTVKTGTNLPYSKALAQYPIPFGGGIDDFHTWNRVESAQTQHTCQGAGALYIEVANARGSLPKFAGIEGAPPKPAGLRLSPN